MVLGEAAGGVATIAALQEVALVVVVERVAEVTFHVVHRAVGVAVVAVAEGVDLLDIR